MSSTDPAFHNSLYVGINIQEILYGIELVLYFKAMHALLLHQRPRKKSDVFYAIFSTVMLLMITTWISVEAIFGEKMWVRDADDYPGGPNTYMAPNISVWYLDWGVTAVTILQLMTDALTIYRCWMVWDSYQVVLVPVILWLATLVLGVLATWTSSSPRGSFFSGTTAQLGLSYYSVSVWQAAMLTAMISYRVITHGRKVRKHIGKDYANVYFTLLSLVIESMLPYTLSGIAFLVSFGLESHISNVFKCVYLMMMCVSPQMLILRVASGQAWAEETGRATVSSVRSAAGDASACQWTESRGFDDSSAAQTGKETV